jgi:predicted HTH domain antitoxin
MEFVKLEDQPVQHRLVKDLVKQKHKTLDLKYELLIKYFEIALDSKLHRGRLTLTEISKIAGMTRGNMELAVKFVKYFNYDKNKFIEFAQKHNCTTLTAVNDIITNLNKELIRTNLQKIWNPIRIYLRQIRAREEVPTEDITKDLFSLRRTINKYYPPNSLQDLESIKFHACCCCGEYPPPEQGFDLTSSKEIHGLIYPVCDVCQENNIEPIWKNIAAMYYSYACSIENVYSHYTTIKL